MKLAEQLATDPLGPRSCGISDNEIAEMARGAFDRVSPTVRATRGRCICWVAPFRKEGIIEVPWDFTGNSVEAVMWDDGTPMEIPRGTLVMIRPDEGILHEVNGVTLCFIEGEHVMLIQEAA